MTSYQEYLRSERWAELRRERFQIDGWRCRLCNTSRRIACHHRKYPQRLGTETVDDLTTLCQECHERFHGIRHHRSLPVLTIVITVLVLYLLTRMGC